MDGVVSGLLTGSEIHGFRTLQDLDVPNIMEEAGSRWLRPNEIYAILCNPHYFTIYVKPVHLPRSGAIVLFDRKMLRNFRKDGHNWKKKKDGKTVKEAHEHLKVGNEERIHVYYAHGQDNSTFVRRCYWLLDKSLEHIVLVHYRDTREGSPVTPMNSNSSLVSGPTAHWVLAEEPDLGAGNAYPSGKELEPGYSLSVRNHEQRLHEINTLDWDELVANDPNNLSATGGDKISRFEQQSQFSVNGSVINDSPFPTDMSAFGTTAEAMAQKNNLNFNISDNAFIETVQVNSEMRNRDSIGVGNVDSLEVMPNDGLRTQDSFGRWMDSIIADSPGSGDDSILESSVSSGQTRLTTPAVDHHQVSVPQQIFKITDTSPGWASSTEETKILITGLFCEEYCKLENSNIYCICGDACVAAEIVQLGVYRCFVPPHTPGIVNLFMSFDGCRPISQVLNFEYRATLVHDPVVSSEDETDWETFQVQIRLAQLLFSTSKCLSILSTKLSPAAFKEAKKFYQKTANISNRWSYLMKSIEDNRTSVSQAKDVLFELTLKSRLIEWLLERVIEGGKSTEYDAQGQGVSHLCAILGYTWVIPLFQWSGFPLDFRDKYGWTALHWAAYCGREKMVAVLLSAGARPYLVTDPTSENPAGCTAADLASKKGYEGLAAYLSEKSLVEHFKTMIVTGNASGSLPSASNKTERENPENLSEEELNLKDTLAAYRTTADAAARIQAAFREQSFKLQSKAVESSNPEAEARNIIAAMKIQHAFRNYEARKRMAAAARIQHRFRTWKMRREFLNMRHQAIKIQAAFRGFQVRRQYRKIIWSVGVLEKAILRWRLRRKGFRGLTVDSMKEAEVQKQDSDTEEEFFRASRKQAEERVEKAVVRVQSMFRSKKAQQEYRRMKLTHNQANLEYEDLLNPDIDMDN